MQKMASPAGQFAVHIVRRLSEAGHRALLAGGCVRDRLLGREPKDYDVATAAHPEQVRALFPHSLEIGAAFGVICVLGERPSPDQPPLQVEVATFRRDGGYVDGRHPDGVEFVYEVEDVKRRDFTVNGLLYDPLRDEVLDYVGGHKDLASRSIRAIGDPRRRFREDRLRMLRAPRFAAALDFRIDGLTASAIRKEAPHIHEVSAERIREELSKMLAGPRPRHAMELLKSLRLLKEILPEVDAMAGVEQSPRFHPEGDVWAHTLTLLDELDGAPLTLAWAALLHDVGKPPTFVRGHDRIRFNDHERVGATMTEAVLRRLKYPREVIERVMDLVAQHMVFKDVKRMRPAKLKCFLRRPHFEEHLELHRLDCLASHGNLDAHAFCRQQLATLPDEKLRPPPLIDGEDLKRLGLVPGPLFKQILKEVEEAQLEGRLESGEAALEYVRARYAPATVQKANGRRPATGRAPRAFGGRTGR
jgi:poly(A) polymerase